MRLYSRSLSTLSIIIGLLVPYTSSVSQSESGAHPFLDSPFVIDAGMFFPESDFRVTVKGTIDLDPFDPIDFEETLGSDIDEEIGAIQFTWRFGEKWSLSAQYMSFEDRTSAVLTEDVEWGDITFGAGTGVGAGLDTTITRLFFGRQFRHDDRQEFGIGVGAHLLDMSAFIEGDAVINGVPDGFRTEVVETNGLLPNLGAWYIYSFSPRWAFKTRLDWLGADIGKYSGQIINAALGINFRVFKHVGIGLNYNWLELDVEVDDDPWQGELVTRSRGFFVYLSAYW